MTKPAPEALSAVRLSTTAVAFGGTTPTPATCTSIHPSAGTGAFGAAGVRVSKMRVGVMGTNRELEDGEMPQSDDSVVATSMPETFALFTTAAKAMSTDVSLTRMLNDFVAAVSGSAVAGGLGPDIGVDPIAWALDVLGLDGDTIARLRAEEAAVDEPEPVVGGVPERLVRKQFRVLLRQAHPDHGGAERSAAARIAELTEARRLLTGA